MNQLSPDKVALLQAVTDRLTGRGSAWLGLLDEQGNELTSPGYARHRLQIKWDENQHFDVTFNSIGPCRVAKVALFDAATGGKPNARVHLQISANSIPVRPGDSLHVSATFPNKHTS